MTTFDKCKKRWSDFQLGTQVNGSEGVELASVSVEMWESHLPWRGQ